MTIADPLDELASIALARFALALGAVCAAMMASGMPAAAVIEVIERGEPAKWPRAVNE